MSGDLEALLRVTSDTYRDDRPLDVAFGTYDGAVGNALNSNPVCVIVPCHRVVREDGELGDYAGGVAAKRHLLNVERRESRA